MDLTGRKCNLKEADAYVLLLNIMFDLIINCQWWRGRSCSALLRVQCFAFKENKWQKVLSFNPWLNKRIWFLLPQTIHSFQNCLYFKYKFDNKNFWLAFSFFISFFLFFFFLLGGWELVSYMKTFSEKWFWINAESWTESLSESSS